MLALFADKPRFRQNRIHLSGGSSTVRYRKGPLECGHHSGPYHQPEWRTNRMASRAETSDLQKQLAVRQVTTFEGYRVLVIINARRCQGDVGIQVGPSPIKYEQTNC